MNAIAINGSAREAGNTEILLKKCLGILKEEGIPGELIRLSEKKIAACTACGKCFKNRDGKCVLGNDDFDAIFQKMVAADIIVLGAPVYFGSAPADLKALMDRAGYVSRANGNLFTRKLGGPVVVARRAGQNFTYAQLMFWFMIAGMVMPGSTYWNIGFGLAPGEVNEDQEALETVAGFARNLAWLAKKLYG